MRLAVLALRSSAPALARARLAAQVDAPDIAIRVEEQAEGRLGGGRLRDVPNPDNLRLLTEKSRLRVREKATEGVRQGGVA